MKLPKIGETVLVRTQYKKSEPSQWRVAIRMARVVFSLNSWYPKKSASYFMDTAGYNVLYVREWWPLPGVGTGTK